MQNFGLRICAKQWDLSYNELLSNFDVPTLSDRKLYLKLATMYKIVHDLLVFPPVFVRHSTRAYVNSESKVYCAHLFHIIFHFGTHYLIVLLMDIHSLPLSHS